MEAIGLFYSIFVIQKLSTILFKEKEGEEYEECFVCDKHGRFIYKSD